MFATSLLFTFSLSLTISVFAQSTATLRGTVTDSTGAVVAGASVLVQNQATGVENTTKTNEAGNYALPALPVGSYRVQVRANGMQAQSVTGLVLGVSQTVGQDFKMQVAATSTEVVVMGDPPVLDTTSITVGQLIDGRTVQEIPLNGRHLVDLGLLIPGSVTPPANGFLTFPLRGQGSFQFNTAGNREDTVNFMVNGVNLNDMVQNQITFQPSINTVQEFKVDNSTYSAEYGRNSGAIVNIATRGGSKQWHGEAFDFLRNDFFDARNFFNKASVSRIAPFKRNSFGANLGGPIWKNRTFFFVSYEGLRQRQGITINSGVLTEADRGAVTDPAAQKLLDVIPHANDPTGNLFIGSATAPVNIDQWTGDVSHNFSERDRLHGYYAFQRDRRQEPTLQGNTIPGFGDTRQSHRQIFTLNETHVFSPGLVNEGRFGFNRIHITFTPNAQLNPADFNIGDGETTAIGLPQITLREIGLNFGGPAGFAQGRGDMTAVVSDTLNWLHGNHNFKFGGEFRRFYNNNFNGDTGQFVFNKVADFQQGLGTSFQITPGTVLSHILVNALGGFVMDNWKIAPRFTLELGLRYDWNATPTEKDRRFVVFDPSTISLIQTNSIYDQSNKNFEPRLGFAWDLYGKGKTVLRAGYGYMVDQPVSNAVTGLASNPPFASPVVASSTTPTIPITSALAAAGAAGLAPSTINSHFRDSNTQSWNLNLQQELTPSLGLMIGYFGSKGTHLRLSRNLNQLDASGVRPFPQLSPSSPILPPNPNLSNITELDSPGNSHYNALWATAHKHMSHNLQFNASYTWSKSIDYNSLSSQGVVIQNSFNPARDKGLSDYDVRHRFVIDAIYDLPFHGNRLWEGWELASVLQVQTGSPFTILKPTSFTGVTSLHPDQFAPVNIHESLITSGSNAGRVQWFTAPAGALVDPGNTFGNMQRNAVEGPGFDNLDFSVIKNTRISERVRAQFRAETFNIVNHPNFSLPGRFLGTGTFGVITGTRFPTGDSGSSRQLQFAVKLIF